MAVPFVTSRLLSQGSHPRRRTAITTNSSSLIGAFTAFLTAFYMTRLVIVAFLGKPRAHGADHAHEVPPSC